MHKDWKKGVSVRGVHWKYKDFNIEDKQIIHRKSGFNELICQCLVSRGITPDRLDSYLYPKLKTDLKNPDFIQDMSKAASLFFESIESGKKIAVFADYDVDGASSAAQIIRYGQLLGIEIDFYIPDRFKEGYGPTPEAFKILKSRGNHVIITLDCGSLAYDAMEFAFQSGLKTIIIDHHLMPDQTPFPKHDALVNPNRPDDSSGLEDLTASGVSFLFLIALNREARNRKFFTQSGIEEPNLFDFLGLAALGTVCDVAPLTGLNRTFVFQGLKALSHPKWSGLSALIEVSEIQESYKSYHLGFMLGPRLNAGSRIGKPDLALRLLITQNPNEAIKLAHLLDSYNKDRQHIEAQITEEAIEQIDHLKDQKSDLIIVDQENWHIGVIGIVASRLKEYYSLPSIVIGFDPNTGLGKASGRSIEGVNLGAAIADACKEGLLITGGGHKKAIGLTIEKTKLTAFKSYLNKRLSSEISQAKQDQMVEIDGGISFKNADLAFVSSLSIMEPYGVGNPKPIFLFSTVYIHFAKEIKNGHIKLNLKDQYGFFMDAIIFRASMNSLESVLSIPANQALCVIGTLSINHFKGKQKVNLHIMDLMHIN